MVKKIKLLALDIDGVLTDGRTTLGARQPERKRLAFQDLDAINAAKRAGLTVALVTGESDGSVDLVAARTGVTLVRRGAKDKLAALKSLAKKLKLSLLEICYVGDGNRDAPALAKVGLSFAPANATFAAKCAAQRVLEQSGGHGVVAEVVRLLMRRNDEQQRANLLEREIRAELAKNSTGNFATDQRLVLQLTKAALAMVRALESGHKIMLCGDVAESAHEELYGTSFAWPAFVLSSTPKLSRQVQALARPQDAIIVFNSNNFSAVLLKVLKRAESVGSELVIFDNNFLSSSPDFNRSWRAVCRIAFGVLKSID